VVREGPRLGVHLIAAAEPADAQNPLWESALRLTLTGRPEGRGELLRPDGSGEPFQAGRVTGRIPRTSTLRPTVVPLDWSRAGDPPARRPVRELGNGPTDIALLASAAARAARSDAAPAASPA
jgi:S-DNA-T family DNA segregation ATPase FtsK/SpoIIIE